MASLTRSLRALVAVCVLAAIPVVSIAAARPASTPAPPGRAVSTPALTPGAPTAVPDAAPTPAPHKPYRHLDSAGQVVATWLDVPFISQLPDMPTGCEATSVAMLLQFAGVEISKEQVAAEMPYSDDPNLGFQGDPYDYSGGIIYPPALLDLVRSHVGTAEDLSGIDLDTLKATIDAGKPVIVWFLPTAADSHTVVVTGYTDTDILINDPAEGLTDPFGYIPDSPGDGKNLALPIDAFLQYWGGSGNLALSY